MESDATARTSGGAGEWRQNASRDHDGGETLSILTWNINCLLPTVQNMKLRHKSFKGFFDHLGVDLACFQEVKLPDARITKELACVEGFQSFWATSRSKPGYSGVTTWCRSETATPRGAAADCLGGDEQPELDTEGRCVLTDHGAFVLLNVYVPNAGDRPERARLPYKLAFLRALRAKMDELTAAGRQVITVGDLNIAAEPRDVHAAVGFDTLYDDVELAELRSLVAAYPDVWRRLHPEEEGAYTVWEERTSARAFNVGLRIDYVLVSPGLLPYVASCEILPPAAIPPKWSDHAALLLRLRVRRCAVGAATAAVGVAAEAEQPPEEHLAALELSPPPAAPCPLWLSMESRFVDRNQKSIRDLFGKRPTGQKAAAAQGAIATEGASLKAAAGRTSGTANGAPSARAASTTTHAAAGTAPTGSVAAGGGGGGAGVGSRKRPAPCEGEQGESEEQQQLGRPPPPPALRKRAFEGQSGPQEDVGPAGAETGGLLWAEGEGPGSGEAVVREAGGPGSRRQDEEGAAGGVVGGEVGGGGRAGTGRRGRVGGSDVVAGVEATEAGVVGDGRGSNGEVEEGAEGREEAGGGACSEAAEVDAAGAEAGEGEGALGGQDAGEGGSEGQVVAGSGGEAEGDREGQVAVPEAVERRLDGDAAGGSGAGGSGRGGAQGGAGDGGGGGGGGGGDADGEGQREGAGGAKERAGRGKGGGEERKLGRGGAVAAAVGAGGGGRGKRGGKAAAGAAGSPGGGTVKQRSIQAFFAKKQ